MKKIFLLLMVDLIFSSIGALGQKDPAYNVNMGETLIAKRIITTDWRETVRFSATRKWVYGFIYSPR
jgi:hypothetical protein